MAAPAPRAGSVRAKLVTNTVLAVAFVAISAPQATRIPVHEWLSFAFIVVLVLHLLFSWNWISNVARRLLATLRGQVRFNFVWDALLYAAMTVVMISGIVISESALPWLGFPRPRDRFWSVVHDFTAEALLVMVGVHLAMHWDWIVAALRRLVAGSLTAASTRMGNATWWVRPTALLALVAIVLSGATLAFGRTPVADDMRQPRRRGALAAQRDGASAVSPQPAQSAPGEPLPKGRRNRAGGGERRREAPGLGARQRFLQPAAKIVGFMGGPFVVTLIGLTLLGRRASVPEARRDPLHEDGE